jgi:hypothetical protein
MSKTEEVPEIVVARTDWEKFVSSLERLMALHQRTLQKLRDMRSRNRALRTELRSAVALPTLETRTIDRATISLCPYCEHEIQESASFCDQCGSSTSMFLCECGRTVRQKDVYCDGCGRELRG